MPFSTTQLVGFGVVAAIIAAALLFAWYKIPKNDALFQPSLKSALYWLIGIIVFQTVFITLGT